MVLHSTAVKLEKEQASLPSQEIVSAPHQLTLPMGFGNFPCQPAEGSCCTVTGYDQCRLQCTLLQQMYGLHGLNAEERQAEGRPDPRTRNHNGPDAVGPAPGAG